MSRRKSIVFTGVVAAVLAMASVAMACTALKGRTTLISPTSATGGDGTVITASGKNAQSNSQFSMVLGNDHAGGNGAGHRCMSNVNVLYQYVASSNKGAIPATSGAIQPSFIRGERQLCFLEFNSATSTGAVLFTVL